MARGGWAHVKSGVDRPAIFALLLPGGGIGQSPSSGLPPSRAICEQRAQPAGGGGSAAGEVRTGGAIPVYSISANSTEPSKEKAEATATNSAAVAADSSTARGNVSSTNDLKSGCARPDSRSARSTSASHSGPTASRTGRMRRPAAFGRFSSLLVQISVARVISARCG